ncbi:uncharacterized protein BXIN_2773 [Babesia sp. Xinjiang]|uniref:uncharacterized protein n=1 Tax=Babesia sp. Xinjiang TaxID=462227 RepID=UPI000A23066F|nr:uncharacterized protein BXIN_2773 [Babesia sp. Xinjiang]ORM41666.1 hypothetical protein BXIN_2773 [Babesia sp. Xinjiang]
MLPEKPSLQSLTCSISKTSITPLSTPRRYNITHTQGKTLSIDSLDGLKFVSDLSCGYTASSSPRSTPIATSRSINSTSLHATPLSAHTEETEQPAVKNTWEGANSQSAIEHFTQIANDNEANQNGENEGLEGRAAGLTKSSGLRQFVRGSLGARKQLLLDGSGTSILTEPRKRRLSRRGNAKRDATASTATLNAPCNGVMPFWLSAPKDLKDIGNYVKTICSRISNIEKNIRNFEAERQSLLNALYQLNLQQVQTLFPNTWTNSQESTTKSQSPKSNDDSTKNTPEKNDDVAEYTANNQTTDSETGTVTYQPQTPIQDNQIQDAVGQHYQISPRVSSDTPHPTILSHPENSVAESNTDNITATSNENHENDNLEVIVIDDDDEENKPLMPQSSAHTADSGTSRDDFSQQLLQDCKRKTSQFDSDIELIASKQVERNVPDYNQQRLTETDKEFRLWTSCWLQNDNQPEDTPSPIQLRRSVSGPKTRSNEQRQSVTATGDDTRTDSPAQQIQEPSLDPLKRYWDLEFNTMSQQNLLKWVRFFGVKVSQYS